MSLALPQDLWRIHQPMRIAPFSDPPQDILVGDSFLGEVQTRALGPRGIQVHEIEHAGPWTVGPGLVLFDNCYFNGAALDHLLRAQDQATRLSLRLAPGDLADFVGQSPAAPGDVPEPISVGLFLLADTVTADSAQDLYQQLDRDAQAVLLPEPPSRAERIANFAGQQTDLKIPAARALACSLSHWPQILWLNQALAYADDFCRRKNRHGVVLAEGVKVHPTAYLEHCIIGEGSEIDAHASVIDSIVGARCRIADHSSLTGCVLANDGQTLTDSQLRRVVAYPQATVSNLGLEEVLLGRASFVTTASIFFTSTPFETTSYVVDGQRWPSQRPLLGSSVGHRCILGARAIFQPGLALPNDTTVVMRPEEGVARIDPVLKEGQPACWNEGRLVPLAEVFPEHQPPELDPQ